LGFLNCENKCDITSWGADALFFTITNHIKEENVDDDDESGKEMVALRNRFKNLLRHEHVIDKKNDEEEEDDDDHEMSLANATGKFSVLFAASQLFYGTLCREAPNERIIYNNRSSNEIEDVKEGEEELDDSDDFVAQPEEEEEETNEKGEEAEKDLNQKDKWKELIQAFEMQRKRDELETKLNELEHEGVTLEKSIQDDDDDDENEMSLSSSKTTTTTTAREKLNHLIAMVRLKNKMHNILDKINTR